MKEAEKEGNKVKNQNSKSRNNDIFGKLIEKPMKKIDIKFVTTRRQYSWSFRRTFKRKKQFCDRAIATERKVYN